MDTGVKYRDYISSALTDDALLRNLELFERRLSAGVNTSAMKDWYTRKVDAMREEATRRGLITAGQTVTNPLNN